jgi:hypothetical protein
MPFALEAGAPTADIAIEFQPVTLLSLLPGQH